MADLKGARKEEREEGVKKEERQTQSKRHREGKARRMRRGWEHQRMGSRRHPVTCRDAKHRRWPRLSLCWLSGKEVDATVAEALLSPSGSFLNTPTWPKRPVNGIELFSYSELTGVGH